MKAYNEELFELMIKHASALVLDEMMDEFASFEEISGEYRFSKQFEKKAEALIQDRKKAMRETPASGWQRIKRAGKRVAIVACVFVAVVSLAAFTIEPVRVAVANFFLEHRDGHIEMHMQQRPFGESDGRFADIYCITPYLPEGFEIVEVMENGVLLNVTYKNKAGEVIRLERGNGNASMAMDSEGAGFEKFNLGEWEGFAIQKKGQSSVMFHDDRYAYLLTGRVDKEELIKMAQSMVD